MKSFFLTVLLFCSVLISLAQCNVNRYLSAPFQSARTFEDLNYHSAWTLGGLCLSESSISFDSFDLDIYEPVGDNLEARPCIIFAHGGSFLAGNKQTNPVPEFCYRMAERGFVVASIDYRKCFNPLSTQSGVRAVYRAVQDMKAAVRFIKASASALGIDSSMVFTGGNSAGAIMALHTAYLDENERQSDLQATYLDPDLGCLNCPGNNQLISSKPRGVINLWGAIADTSWISGSNNYPVISFHGTADDVVFYTVNNPFGFPVFPELFGSFPLHQRLGNSEIAQKLFPLEGAPHEAWNDPAVFDLIVDSASAFLYEEFLKPPQPVLTADIPACTGQEVAINYSSEENLTTCLEVSGGEIAGYAENQVLLAFDTPGEYTVSAWHRNQWGALGDTTTLTFEVYPSPEPFDLIVSADSILAPQGFQYIWTLNGEPILNAQDSFFLPDENGVYQVQITDENGCAVWSNPLNYISVSVQKHLSGYVLFPNPASSELFIDGIPGVINLGIFNMSGIKLRELQVSVPGRIESEGLPAGTYLFVVTSDLAVARRKVVIAED